MTWLGADELDLLVLGSGVAGLSAAVRAADELALRVGVLTKSELSQAATRWAQGGVAAVLAGDPDSTDLHLADTLGAGAGLCDVDAVRVLVDEGPSRVNELIAMGAMFDRDREGRLQLAREGGHSLPRIVHAGGAATGAEIERALVEEVRETAVACWEQWFALDLLVDGGRCVGVAAMDHDGAGHRDPVPRTCCWPPAARASCYAATTNPAPVDRRRPGHGAAGRRGVRRHRVRAVPPDRAAQPQRCRGRCCRRRCAGTARCIRDLDGKRFVDELQPRDVVARAITRKMLEEDADHMLLDATGLERFDERFPTIAADLRSAGLDPATDYLPIAPAAHYHCGGIVTDLDGASSLPGLWAAGEVACTGVHGANRLASNSLLEGMVFGPRVIEAIGRGVDGPSPTGAMRAVVERRGRRRRDRRAGGRPAGRAGRRGPGRRGRGPASELRDRLQRAMTRGAGVLRDARSLRETGAVVAATLAAIDGLPEGPEREELRNLATVGWALLPRRRGARGEPGLPHPGGLPRPRPGVPAPPGPALRPSSAPSLVSAFDPPIGRAVAERRPPRPRRGPRPARRHHRRAGAAVGPRRRVDGGSATAACSPGGPARRRPSARSSRPSRWTGSGPTATVWPAATTSRVVAGPLAVGPHRGAHRAQLPLPPLRRGDRHPPPGRRRRGGQPAHAGLGHPQDAARAARRSRRRRCGPAAASTTGARCPTWCW